MKNGFGGRLRLWALAGLACLIFASVPALAAQPDTLLDDARVTGQTIYLFSQDGQQIMIVEGRFRLTVGERIFSGKSAVVWVKDTVVDSVTQHEITAYIEGMARVIEPRGIEASDRTMVVTLLQQGRLSASGKASSRDLDDFPIYERALEARARSQKPLLAQATTQGAATQSTTTQAIATQPDSPAETPPARQTMPINFRGEQASVRQLDPKTRVAILRGNVYVSQGNPESDQFMELRCQDAVVFIEKGVAPKNRRTPLSANLPTFGEDESVAGVFLKGDVRVSQGFRTLRAPEAFFDFANDRAIIPHPVFKTVQPQRNIPIYVRAKEMRQLSSREFLFQDAKISTSDFYNPSYSVGARQLKITDLTKYDAEGNQISERGVEAEMKHTTFNVGRVPLMWWPYQKTDVSEGSVPLRRVSVGNNGRFGTGVETEWDFFRLFGLPQPQGVKGEFELDAYSRGVMVGSSFKYARRDDHREYTGYAMLYGMYDAEGEDDFGTERKNIPAPDLRGRALVRHKEYLPREWELQFELSYICDRNFMEEFFRDEWFAGKEQETLVYAKKQRDSWAFTALLQYRLNRFQTQTESWPDLGFYLVGKPLAGGYMTVFSENHLGAKKWRPDTDTDLESSDLLGRADTRNEVDIPLHLGPVNVTPYAVGRLSDWTDTPTGGNEFRNYGQTGVKSNLHIWRLYEDVRSRFWNLNRLKHIITPEAAMWIAGNNVDPDQLFPMDQEIEGLTGVSGGSFGVYQRLQTWRGAPGEQRKVDWMRFDVVAAFFDDPFYNLPADGRFYFSRPETSLARNAINLDYLWNISDSTAFLADANYDINDREWGRADAGFAVTRNPRLRYYLGVRMIDDLDTTVGTFGFNYKLSEKYSISFFEQYDFQFDDGENLITTVSIVRKFARWYAALTFEYDRTQESVGAYITLWPEGIPEVRVGSGRLSPLGSSSLN